MIRLVNKNFNECAMVMIFKNPFVLFNNTKLLLGIFLYSIPSQYNSNLFSNTKISLHRIATDIFVDTTYKDNNNFSLDRKSYITLITSSFCVKLCPFDRLKNLHFYKLCSTISQTFVVRLIR